MKLKDLKNVEMKNVEIKIRFYYDLICITEFLKNDKTKKFFYSQVKNFRIIKIDTTNNNINIIIDLPPVLIHNGKRNKHWHFVHYLYVLLDNTNYIQHIL